LSTAASFLESYQISQSILVRPLYYLTSVWSCRLILNRELVLTSESWCTGTVSTASRRSSGTKASPVFIEVSFPSWWELHPRRPSSWRYKLWTKIQSKKWSFILSIRYVSKLGNIIIPHCSFRACHGLRQISRDDYFRVSFDHFCREHRFLRQLIKC